MRRSIFIVLTAGTSSSSRKLHSTSRKSRKQSTSWKAALASPASGASAPPADGATTGADRMRLPASTCALRERASAAARPAARRAGALRNGAPCHAGARDRGRWRHAPPAPARRWTCPGARPRSCAPAAPRAASSTPSGPARRCRGSAWFEACARARPGPLRAAACPPSASGQCPQAVLCVLFFSATPGPPEALSSLAARSNITSMLISAHLYAQAPPALCIAAATSESAEAGPHASWWLVLALFPPPLFR